MNINNKDGFLTDYGFSCGYIHKIGLNFLTLEISKYHGVYNVTLYDHKDNSIKELKDDYFNKLIDAKKYFFKLSKEYLKLSKQKTLNEL